MSCNFTWCVLIGRRTNLENGQEYPVLSSKLQMGCTGMFPILFESLIMVPIMLLRTAGTAVARQKSVSEKRLVNLIIFSVEM